MEATRSPETRGNSLRPLVTVIVPTYNRPEMLRETLQSILRQTLQDFEVIVVNDGGSDVQHVIEPLNRDRKITYLTYETNTDRAAARNTALRSARGKYIAYLDDDDIFYPAHLEKLVRLAESGGHPVVYSDACCARQTQAQGQYVVTDRHIPASNDFDRDEILARNLMPILCVLHEKACLEKSGGFDEALTTLEDWDLWIRMSRHYPFVHLKEATCEFRWRDDGSSTTSAKRADFVRTTRMIYTKHARHSEEAPEVLFFQIYQLRKTRGKEPRTVIEKRLMSRLGRRRYAALWLGHKAITPWLKLRAFVAKLASRQPTVLRP